jgi:hypothetical protein
MKWPHHPNLRKRPRAPSKGRGPVPRAIRRARLRGERREVLCSTQIYDWTHARRRLGCKLMPAGIYSRTRRTLRKMCIRIGRGTGIGRPILWRLRNSGDD